MNIMHRFRYSSHSRRPSATPISCKPRRRHIPLADDQILPKCAQSWLEPPSRGKIDNFGSHLLYRLWATKDNRRRRKRHCNWPLERGETHKSCWKSWIGYSTAVSRIDLWADLSQTDSLVTKSWRRSERSWKFEAAVTGCSDRKRGDTTNWLCRDEPQGIHSSWSLAGMERSLGVGADSERVNCCVPQRPRIPRADTVQSELRCTPRTLLGVVILSVSQKMAKPESRDKSRTRRPSFPNQRPSLPFVVPNSVGSPTSCEESNQFPVDGNSLRQLKVDTSDPGFLPPVVLALFLKAPGSDDVRTEILHSHVCMLYFRICSASFLFLHRQHENKSFGENQLWRLSIATDQSNSG